MANRDMQNLRLNSQDLKALALLAEATGSVASRGPSYGDPSWRTLMRRLAAGDLAVVDTDGTIYSVYYDVTGDVEPVLFSCGSDARPATGGGFERFG